MRSTRHPLSRLFAAMIVSLLTGATVVGTAGSASAEDSFQYWSYYQVQDGAWAYAPKGAGDVVPADGSIEGHRWAATPMGKMNTPRADLKELTFDAICDDDEAGGGEKRVAVIVDFGLEQDALGDDETPAPFADCAVVPEKANGLQVLNAVADVRTEPSSMGVSLCGVDGYPSTRCADTKTNTATPADEVVDVEIRGAGSSDEGSGNEDDDSNLPLLLGVGGIVVLLGAGGVLLARRNKTAA